MSRNQVLISNLDSQQVDDVGKWFSLVQGAYRAVPGSLGAPELGDAGGQAPPGGNASPGGGSGPTGPGVIVQICGRHFHNLSKPGAQTGPEYVVATLIKNIASSKELHELGVSFPVLVTNERVVAEEIVIPGPKHQETQSSAIRAPGGMVGMGGMNVGMGAGPGGGDQTKRVNVDCCPFRVQFVWQPKTSDQAADASSASGAPAAPTTPNRNTQRPGAPIQTPPGPGAPPHRP